MLVFVFLLVQSLVLLAMCKSNKKKTGSHKERSKKVRILHKKLQKEIAKSLQACFANALVDLLKLQKWCAIM